MSDRWMVPLPPDARTPLRVFINGVPQTEGEDFDVEGRQLSFRKPLAKEGKLGFWRWTLMFFNIAGSYRKHDSVDVQWELHGRTRVATELDIVAPDGTRL